MVWTIAKTGIQLYHISEYRYCIFAPLENGLKLIFRFRNRTFLNLYFLWGSPHRRLSDVTCCQSMLRRQPHPRQSLRRLVYVWVLFTIRQCFSLSFRPQQMFLYHSENFEFFDWILFGLDWIRIVYALRTNFILYVSPVPGFCCPASYHHHPFSLLSPLVEAIGWFHINISCLYSICPAKQQHLNPTNYSLFASFVNEDEECVWVFSWSGCCIRIRNAITISMLWHRFAGFFLFVPISPPPANKLSYPQLHFARYSSVIWFLSVSRVRDGRHGHEE